MKLTQEELAEALAELSPTATPGGVGHYTRFHRTSNMFHGGDPFQVPGGYAYAQKQGVKSNIKPFRQDLNDFN
jgi:hypothetical protein